MSLSLVQDYSSEEEAEAEAEADLSGVSDDSRADEREPPPPSSETPNSWNYLEHSNRSHISLLPSPEDLFSEVTGPPEYLKCAATEPIRTRPRDSRLHSADIPRIATQPDKAHPVPDMAQGAPSGAVVEGKARRYDLNLQLNEDSAQGTADSNGGPQVGPGRNAETGLRRPIVSAENAATITEAEKRNRSKIKDKEKNKRMKGQSSHATWKSETEMHLRQQFD